VSLLAADVRWEMPPHRAWYRGRAHVARHLDVRCPGGPGDLRLLPVAANGQPGFALYLRDRSGGGDGVFRPFALQVLTLGPDEITHVATFLGDALFADVRLGPVAGSPGGRRPGPVTSAGGRGGRHDDTPADRRAAAGRGRAGGRRGGDRARCGLRRPRLLRPAARRRATSWSAGASPRATCWWPTRAPAAPGSAPADRVPAVDEERPVKS
jgi:hypothetical protein